MKKIKPMEDINEMFRQSVLEGIEKVTNVIEEGEIKYTED